MYVVEVPGAKKNGLMLKKKFRSVKLQILEFGEIMINEVLQFWKVLTEKLDTPTLKIIQQF